VLAQTFAALCRVPALRKFLWKRWYQFLASYEDKKDWTFMNYGYVGSESSHLKLESVDELDRSCIQLYHHLTASIDFKNREVLEVGSGRGGGVSYLQRYLKPKLSVGLDYSEKAVHFCQGLHKVDGLSFQQGDAEKLPFSDNSWDVILNVESSHCYGSPELFFREVHRVLRPSGDFLYADFRGPKEIEVWVEQLNRSGFLVVRQTNITQNVLAALDEDNERKLKTIRQTVPGFLLKSFCDFAGIRGSAVYELFQKGELLYFSFVLKKR
jgi:SAM-dependent methyltransferase